ncbi:dihydrodipicolinate synthase family protein [Kribbella sp. GL6]|uniref:dihydrodipicolinate synthase family protein n=1 Tax=Kribbella sp. GL6 TaxID=3419765 RepID=UPI003D02522D
MGGPVGGPLDRPVGGPLDGSGTWSRGGRPVVIAAVPTLFADDGSVDLKRNAQLYRRIVDSGVDALFVGGTTGEFPALDDRERVDLVRVALDVAPAHQVIAHAGAASSRQAVRLTEQICSAGAQRLAAVTPYFLPADHQSLIDYYARVCDAANGAGVYAYIYPDLTNTTVDPRQLAELADLPGLIGAKVSIGGTAPITAYAAAVPPGFELLSGSDADLAGVVRSGGRGVVSGVSSAVPEPFLALAAAVADRDSNAEQEAQERADEAVAAIGPSIALLKLALHLRNLPTGANRMALDAPDSEARNRLERLIDRFQPPAVA